MIRFACSFKSPNEMEDVTSASAGDVIACFGVECASMDSFTDGTVQYSLNSMFVPNAVMSLAVRPKESKVTFCTYHVFCKNINTNNFQILNRCLTTFRRQLGNLPEKILP